MTDAYLYDAYGNLLVHKGDTANDFLYCGEQYNATTGLYYLRARYMDPATGTFISMDSYQGSIYDPVSLHKYLYANANPVTYIDPTGYYSMAEMSASMEMATILAGVITIMYVPILRNIQTSMSTTPIDWREHIETFPATRESKQSILVTPKTIIEDDLFEVFPATTKELEDYWLPLVPPMIVANIFLDIFLVSEAKGMEIEYIESGSNSITRSTHAEIRSSQGRNVGNAINDVNRATPSKIYMQDDGRYVVQGNNGRVHILEPNGEIVTTMNRVPNFGDRVRNGRYIPLTESQKIDFVKKFDQYLNSSWDSYRPN